MQSTALPTIPLEAALAYRRDFGWSVLAINPASKRPYVEWTSYQKQPADEATIRSWWVRWPNANVGIVTGEVSQLWVVDVDSDVGRHALAQIDLPETSHVHTSRGDHWYFRRPGPVRNTAKKIEGLDTRGDGGYVVAPPSIHPSGKRYAWESSPWLTPPVGPPPDLVALFVAGSSQRNDDTAHDGRSDYAEIISKGSREGRRNDDAARLAGHYLTHGLSMREVCVLLLPWADRCTPPFNHDELVDTIRSVAQAEGRKRADDARSSGNKRNGRRDEGEPVAPELITVCLADVVPQTISWMWGGRIAYGKVTLLVGDPGLGKSYMTLDLASRLSTGTPLPGQPAGRSEPITTLLLVIEDDLEDTVRPRFDLLYGDPQLVHAIQAVRVGDDERLPRLDSDLRLVEQKLVETGARLLVIDPINAYLGETEGNKDAAIRTVLTPLAALASRTRTAVIAVTHANKLATEAKALYRVMGSLAYVAAARSVLAMGIDPEAPERRVVVQIKSNLAPITPGLGFRIIDGVVTWDDAPVGVTADTIFGSPGGSSGEGAALKDAEEFLMKVLAHGRQESSQIASEARQVSISQATLRRAQASLGIKATRTSFGPGGKWYWELADHSDDGPPF